MSLFRRTSSTSKKIAAVEKKSTRPKSNIDYIPPRPVLFELASLCLADTDTDDSDSDMIKSACVENILQ